MNKLDPIRLSENGPLLIFAHANGYPPRAYRSFLEPFLEDYQVFSVFMRPFWPGSDPLEMKDWRTFRDDYLPGLESIQDRFGKDEKVIGIGHSLGAMTTLMSAIQAPEKFKLLVLIEPVLFPRIRGLLMRVLSPIGILRKFHPLIRGTLRRRTRFDSREIMYQNYRKKSVFSGMPDQVLRDYVDGLASDLPDGGVGLTYSPAWESRVYEKGGIADWYVWRNLSKVKCPVLVMRGEDTYVLFDRVINPMVSKLPRGVSYTMDGTGHLVPLEAPEKTAAVVLGFLNEHL